jgi:hypothetical protein
VYVVAVENASGRWLCTLDSAFVLLGVEFEVSWACGAALWWSFIVLLARSDLLVACCVGDVLLGAVFGGTGLRVMALLLLGVFDDADPSSPSEVFNDPRGVHCRFARGVKGDFSHTVQLPILHYWCWTLTLLP